MTKLTQFFGEKLTLIQRSTKSFVKRFLTCLRSYSFEPIIGFSAFEVLGLIIGIHDHGWVKVDFDLNEW